MTTELQDSGPVTDRATRQEKANANARARYHANHARSRALKNAYAAANRERVNAVKKAYVARNIEVIRKKGVIREQKRRKADPYYRLVHRMRTMLFKFARHGGARPGRNEMFGCTHEEFKAHLASQFVQAMTWANYGKWHVDHIIPCDAFDLTKMEEVKRCFHYSNLRPYWGIKNMKKGSRWDGQLLIAV